MLNQSEKKEKEELKFFYFTKMSKEIQNVPAQTPELKNGDTSIPSAPIAPNNEFYIKRRIITTKEAKSIKKGDCIMIKGRPCKIITNLIAK